MPYRKTRHKKSLNNDKAGESSTDWSRRDLFVPEHLRRGVAERQGGLPSAPPEETAAAHDTAMTTLLLQKVPCMGLYSLGVPYQVQTTTTEQLESLSDKPVEAGLAVDKPLGYDSFAENTLADDSLSRRLPLIHQYQRMPMSSPQEEILYCSNPQNDITFHGWFPIGSQYGTRYETPLLGVQSSGNETPLLDLQSSGYETSMVDLKPLGYETPMLNFQTSEFETRVLNHQPSRCETSMLNLQSSEYETPTLDLQPSEYDAPIFGLRPSEYEAPIFDLQPSRYYASTLDSQPSASFGPWYVEAEPTSNGIERRASTSTTLEHQEYKRVGTIGSEMVRSQEQINAHVGLAFESGSLLNDQRGSNPSLLKLEQFLCSCLYLPVRDSMING